MNRTVKFNITKQLLAANGQPISGQQLADDFGLSRTAIWKHIKELEEEGFEIETVKKKGYVLKSSPDSLQAAKIDQHLQQSDSVETFIIYNHVRLLSRLLINLHKLENLMDPSSFVKNKLQEKDV